ncbi:MAG: 23S rRNA (adenine(2503)-C(2))-methyltransferase RlmN [Paludibacteraceae bacterium]|nr:23S rRNA (adenine(2503)-C(2))-methyltransferase RlmN [Paludibacteraceae bacterium]
MQKLLGMTLPQLKEAVTSLGMPAFTAKQLADWLYKKKVRSVADMHNISKSNREKLASAFEVGCVPPTDVKESVDGTKKYLFPVGSGKYIESVYIPDKDRATLCVSSQIGCKMNCLFCNTGKQGFSGQLSPADILNQIQSVPETDKLTNVVFMGMGEPMDNVDNLLLVLDVLTADYGYAWSPKRITVSSVGLIPGLKRFLAESTCHLAISLHSPFADERSRLMPVQKAYPVAEVIDLIRKFDFSGQRRISFEYIVFKGVNDTEKHADELKRLLRGLPCLVNLIRFHKVPGVPLDGVNQNGMIAFETMLTNRGINTTIRHSRGEDIWAACGLLSTMKQNQQSDIL